MAEGYWITFYRSISDPAALAAYAKLAGPAVTSNGGRFLARGGTVKTYEQDTGGRNDPAKFEWPALLRKLDRIDPSYKQ
jgi:uncharacterized protein (DUF1330 family)